MFLPEPFLRGSGDSFFLRSPSGAHLGPVNHCFDAARESLRFAPARRLTVRKLSPYRAPCYGTERRGMAHRDPVGCSFKKYSRVYPYISYRCPKKRNL